MKKLPLLLVALFCFGGMGLGTASAQRTVVVEKQRNVTYRTKRIYVIENDRPVQRTVFVDERGRYFRRVGDRQVFIERHFDNYPEQYYYRNGRRRPGIKIVF